MISRHAKFLGIADSRDRVTRDGKSGSLNDLQRGRGRWARERGLRHLKNECYDGLNRDKII